MPDVRDQSAMPHTLAVEFIILQWTTAVIVRPPWNVFWKTDARCYTNANTSDIVVSALLVLKFRV
jgi:hypothetical protein